MRFNVRLIALCLAAALLAGCAGGSGSFGSFGGGDTSRPKAIYVGDFVFGDGVVAVDRGFTARLERKVGAFPTFERKQRTNERTNDEIVAAIVVTLREAGFDAQPGNEDTLSLKDDAVVVSGTLTTSLPSSLCDSASISALARTVRSSCEAARSGDASSVSSAQSPARIFCGLKVAVTPLGRLSSVRSAKSAKPLLEPSRTSAETETPGLSESVLGSTPSSNFEDGSMASGEDDTAC